MIAPVDNPTTKLSHGDVLPKEPTQPHEHRADELPLTRHRREEESYEVVIPTKPRKGLPGLCFDALVRHDVPTRSVSIMWDGQSPGWQRISIVTKPCGLRAVTALAEELSCGRSPAIAAIRDAKTD